MARGGKIASKHKTRKKILLEKKGSDESDEDYMVGEDGEFDDSEDEYCFSPDEDESEESMEEFEEEEEEEEEKKKVKKIRRPRGRKVFQGRKNSGVIKPRRKKVAHSDEEEDHVNDKFDGARRRKKGMLSRIKEDEDEDEDYDFEDSEYENDEEFTPDKIDNGDDEEELPLTKRNKLGRLRMPETAIAKGQKRKRKRNAEVVKRTTGKKPKKEQVVGGYNRSDIRNTCRDRNSILQKKKKISEHRGRRKKSSVNFDSNFMNSGSSDHEYTISEEEREQIREAAEFCGRLTSSLRSSSSLKMIKEEEIVPSQRQHPGTKGKEKVVDMKILVGKQICGICLSEEGKRTIRGILNCCSHYFCFACIMEWSKVESRCPLCKQRFATISRTAQVDGEFALRETVIPVPVRDQVYQPSEEELRAYLDPYENVLCTECQQGGDDALMLLCDLCDSPAHTYCVGLGREVPEGNWYCDGCKPTAIALANSQASNPTPENGANYNLSVGSSPGATVRETFDLNEIYVPDTPLTLVTGHSSSPRQSSGDFQGASSASGSGAFTLYERRRIQRQIHQLLNSRSRHASRSDGGAQASGISLFGSQIGQDALIAPQHVTPAQMAPENIYYQGRLSDYANPSICSRFSRSRGQILDNQVAASTDHSFGGLSHSEYVGINSRIGGVLGHQQLQPCSSRSKSGDNTSISPYQFREVSRSPLEKERVQSMVKSHLKSLSRKLELGYTTFKDIARTSTHTILAAVGVEHRWNEVYPVKTRPLSCDHFESRNTCPTGGQCSSCFDWFVRSVVREIMYNRVSPLSMG